MSLLSSLTTQQADAFRQLSGSDLWMGLAIVGLPILASLATFLVGKRMWRGGAILPIAAILASFLLSLRFFLRMLGGGEPIGWSHEWFHAGGFSFPVGLLLDNLSVWLATLVSLLSLLITIFSTAYLADEPDEKLRRYYAVKSLFVAGMLGTVLLDNYLLMFVFWEVMGLCSYLLIGYWYHKESAARAAKKAFLVTRLGDLFLFLGIVLLLVTFHTLSYRELFHHPALAAHKATLFWAGLFIFGGAVGKSAQFPLDIWLPDAMEGPTTVSALIHAATMVKAGVYLVARSFPLLLLSPPLFVVIGVIGGVTAIYTATMALAALDIKRVLAFSTLSQLGYMFLALGAGGVLYLQTGSGAGFTAAMLHLMNHAFFKALLFLGSASVILGMHHHQDLREMGGLRSKMPTTYWTMLIGSLSIAGIIPLSGFWSKDEVLSAAFEAGHHQPVFTLLWVFGILTALLTAFYMFRMMFLAFWGQPRTEMAEHAHESPSVMTVPLLLLAVFAAVSGLWLVAGPGFSGVIHYPYSPDLGEAEHDGGSVLLAEILTSPLTYVSLAVAVIGIWYARRKYAAGLPEAEQAEPARVDVAAAAGTFWMVAGVAVGLWVALLLLLALGLLVAFALPPAVGLWLLAALGVVASVGGMAVGAALVLDLAVLLYRLSKGGWRGLLYNRYYVTELFYEPLGNYVAYGIARLSDLFDRKAVDGAVNGIAHAADDAGARTRRWQDGRLTTYMASIAIGAALLLVFLREVVLRIRW